ncbi:MAG: 4-hydroxy-tetrahydrodipicolinate reductase [Holosporales bacterium]|nr:4-hydroxy-tetrahydrodipicolinate reductase [Holosporales bacterium]
MKISVLGSTGTMGGLVVKAALQDGLTVENRVSSKDNIENLFKRTDVVVDFSCPIATESMLKYIVANKVSIPTVIGTTGLSKVHFDLMNECAKTTPIFHSPSMSFLVAILRIAIHAFAKLLNEDFDVEIMDVHHKLKKDSPSGTALMLGKTIANARNRKFADVANFVRYGIVEQRRRGEIGFAVQRCSNVIGTHEISFMGEYENLKLKHEAHSKETFSKEAIHIAKWLMTQRCGFYTMNDFTRDLITPALKSIYRELFTNTKIEN